MSFLPYGRSSPVAWTSALGASTAMHVATGMLFLSSAIPLLPQVEARIDLDEDAFVTLEIVDAEVPVQLDPVADAALDAAAPETLDPVPEADEIAATPDLLTPADTDAADILPPAEAIAPSDAEADLLTPEDPVVAVETGPVAEPEPVAEADPVVEPEPVVAEADPVVEPEPEPAAEPVVAEATEPVPEPEPVAPSVTETLAVQAAPLTPLVDDGALLVDDLSPIEDTEISPFAEGTGPAPLTPGTPADIVETVEVTELPEPDATVVPVAPAGDVVALLAPADPQVPTVDALPVEPEPAPEPAPEPEPEAQPETAPAPDPAAAPPPAEIAGRIENPTPDDLVIGELIRRIRGTAPQPCVVALPRLAAAGGAGLSMIGADDAATDTLSGQVTAGLAVAATRERIDARQCAALDALRRTAAYPAGRIGLALDATRLQTGDVLRGRIIGAGGLFVTILLVDDNGVVQDLSRFVAGDGVEPAFEVPVARAGPSRDTAQLLLVLGTPDAPLALGDRIGRAAQDVFDDLGPEVLGQAVFGLATFEVR